MLWPYVILFDVLLQRAFLPGMDALFSLCGRRRRKPQRRTGPGPATLRVLGDLRVIPQEIRDHRQGTHARGEIQVVPFFRVRVRFGYFAVFARPEPLPTSERTHIHRELSHSRVRHSHYVLCSLHFQSHVDRPHEFHVQVLLTDADLAMTGAATSI